MHLLGRPYEPLAVAEAVDLGFSPCGLCEPDSALLADARRVWTELATPGAPARDKFAGRGAGLRHTALRRPGTMGYAQPPDASEPQPPSRSPYGSSLGTSRTRVGGSHEGVHGPAIVVAVNAPAGRPLTEAARRALAQALGVPAALVALRTGSASRDKLFPISNPPATPPPDQRALRPPTVINGLYSTGRRRRPVRGEKE